VHDGGGTDAVASTLCPGCERVVGSYAFCEACGTRLSDLSREPMVAETPVLETVAVATELRGATTGEPSLPALREPMLPAVPVVPAPPLPAAAEETDAILIADRVQMAVGTSQLLQPTSLQVEPSELVALIGPSGAGKSTLLRTLAGVTRPTAGTVSLGGDDIALRLSEIGYVPQFDTVHHQLTVTEALTFAAELRLDPGIDEAARQAAVTQAIEEVGLAARADALVGSLSGGERKRVSVAMEVISRPRVLFLDEPTTGLDPGLELKMMRLLRSQADLGRAVVLVTHATQSLQLCDRIAVMAPGGRLLWQGRPAAAASAFGVDSIEAIYNVLKDGDDALPEPPDHADAPVPVRTSETAGPARALGPQVRTLVRRASLLMARDRRFLMIAGLQAVGLGALTALLFGAHVFDRNAVPAQASQSSQLLFLMITVTIWFGAFAAARQIVSERGVLRRELSAGLRVESYLAAKALVLGTVTAAQTVLFTFVILLLRPLSRGFDELLIVLLLSTWCGVALGLVVSAYAQTEDQATGLIPVVLIPQLLFGGAIVTVSQMSILVKALSWLAMAQWAYAGAGHAIGMNQRIASDPLFAQSSRYGHAFFAHPAILTVLILGFFIAVLSAVVFRRIQPDNGIEGVLVRGSIAWWKLLAQEKFGQIRGAEVS
jgi:ABC transport system ATP-binding/permease protein